MTPTAFEIFFGGPQLVDERERSAREDRFFHSIRLANGTYKSTAHRRLDDLNRFVMEFLPRERPLEAMDVAVSSGVSTAEWLLALDSAGIECNMLAGDAVVDARLISVGSLRALAEKTGHLLQLDVSGHAIPLPPPGRFDRLRYAPMIAFMQAATWLFDLQSRTIQRRCGVTCRPLTLMSRSLSQLPRIRTVEDDILHDIGYVQRFHVLRAANILNRAYFDVKTLERMLANLRSRLLPGGLLIVCRTNDAGMNNATVFTLGTDGRFTATARLNEGSEIADLVLGLEPGQC